jgi:hypothetical protein
MASIQENDERVLWYYRNFDDPRFDPYALSDRDQASFEKTLNVLGYIPIISSASGVVRMASAVIRLIASAVKIPLCAIADLFQKTPRGYLYRIQVHTSYLGHSWANFFRGFVELFLIFGNVLTFSYDQLIGRIRYPIEKN